jgi:hypothetical protein
MCLPGACETTIHSADSALTQPSRNTAGQTPASRNKRSPLYELPSEQLNWFDYSSLPATLSMGHPWEQKRTLALKRFLFSFLSPTLTLLTEHIPAHTTTNTNNNGFLD